MTSLNRPRHGAGGQVEARGYSLDCCALEHRLLFSAAPLALLESTESADPSIHCYAHGFDGGQEFHTEVDDLTDLDEIRNELFSDPLCVSLEDWSNGTPGDLETGLADLTNPSLVEVLSGHSVSAEHLQALLTSIDVDADQRVNDVMNEIPNPDHDEQSKEVVIQSDGYGRDDAQSTSTIPTNSKKLSDDPCNIATNADASQLVRPSIHDIDTSLNAVFENATPGTPVGITVHSPADDLCNSVYYELIDDADGRFAIDKSTGVVSVANGSLLDREADSWHVIVIQAWEDDGTVSQDEIVVDILDVNDNALEFRTSPSQMSSEHSLLATTITAVDADVAGQSITYAIAGGADASRFSIDSITGDLRFISSPDFEAPKDSDRNNVYVVEIEAFDNQGSTASLVIDIVVMNENDLPISKNDLLSAQQDTVLSIRAETLLANDADADGDSINVQVVQGPLFGTLVVNPDGSMSYRPEPGFLGSDTFTYYATDGNGAGNMATVEIQVSAESTTQRGNEAAEARPRLASAVPQAADIETAERLSELELNLHAAENRVHDIQQYLRKRISSAMELFKQVPHDDPVDHLESLGEQHVASNFEPNLARSNPRSMVSVSNDRYRPTSLLAQLDTRALDHQLDLMIDTMSEQVTPEFVVAGATMSTAAMSIGYVVWTTQTSYMVASLVAATPGWKRIEPLPILDFREVDGPTDGVEDRLDINRMLQDHQQMVPRE